MEKHLRPTELTDKIDYYIIPQHIDSRILADAPEIDPEVSYTKLQDIAKEIGIESANEYYILNIVIPKLLGIHNIRVFYFGYGLAIGADNPYEIWQLFRTIISKLSITDPHTTLLKGFINSLWQKDNDLANKILDETVVDEILFRIFPILQSAVEIDMEGIDRLLISLKNNDIPVANYTYLSYGETHLTIPDEKLIEILHLISLKKDGVFVALDILSMIFHSVKKDNIVASQTLLNFGQSLALDDEILFSKNYNEDADFNLTEIIEFCFEDNSSNQIIEDFWTKLVLSFRNHNRHVIQSKHLLKVLVKKNPLAFLNVCFEKEDEVDYITCEIISEYSRHDENILSVIDNEVIIDWCNIIPDIRYPLISSVVDSYRLIDKKYEWSTLAMSLIKECPNVIHVLDKLILSFYPSFSYGSRAEFMSKLTPLLSELLDSSNPDIASWAINNEAKYLNAISKVREEDICSDRTEHQSFE